MLEEVNVVFIIVKGNKEWERDFRTRNDAWYKENHKSLGSSSQFSIRPKSQDTNEIVFSSEKK